MTTIVRYTGEMNVLFYIIPVIILTVLYQNTKMYCIFIISLLPPWSTLSDPQSSHIIWLQIVRKKWETAGGSASLWWPFLSLCHHWFLPPGAQMKNRLTTLLTGFVLNVELERPQILPLLIRQLRDLRHGGNLGWNSNMCQALIRMAFAIHNKGRGQLWSECQLFQYFLCLHMRRFLLVGDEQIGWLAGEHIVPSIQCVQVMN